MPPLTYRKWSSTLSPGDTSTWPILFDAGSLTAAEVNPSALDRPYDGVDQDCAGDATLDNEYDWDGDGDRTQLQEHVESTTGNLVSGGDCMDCSDNCDGVTEGDDWFDLCSALCDNDSYVDNDYNNYDDTFICFRSGGAFKGLDVGRGRAAASTRGAPTLGHAPPGLDGSREAPSPR